MMNESNLGSVRPRAVNTILLGGLAAGIGDLLFAFTFYGYFRHFPYLRIFQGVAAGLLGLSALQGGISTFVLGILLHFVVATCIAAVFFLASRFLPFLIRYAVICGPIYGMIAYLVMNHVVIPLSAIPRRPRPFVLKFFLIEIIAHAFLVGLPIALIARRTAQRAFSQA